MNRITLLMFALAATSPTSGFSQDALRWKFSQGAEWKVTLEQKSDVVSTISSTSTTMTLDTGMELLWKVESITQEGSAVVSQRFRRLHMTLEMPKTGPISYDSATEGKATGDAKMIADAVQPLLDAGALVTLSPRGEIEAVELDEAAQKAIAGLEGNKVLQSLLSKEGLTNILRQTAVVLPENEVQPGDEWQRSAALDTPLGKLQQRTTFKLLPPESKAPSVARIQSESRLELPPATRSRAVELKQQAQNGLILFDNEAGYLKSAEIKQELVTTSSLKDTPVQVKLTSTLKMSVDPK